MTILGVTASSKPPVTGSYDSIASVDVSTGSTVTFSNIPQTYKHLQIRGWIIGTSGYFMYMRVNNNNTGYAYNEFEGRGSNAYYLQRATNDTGWPLTSQWQGTSSSIPNLFIVDLLDYTRTTAYPTYRCYGGTQQGANSGAAFAYSGTYASETAVTSLNLFMNSGGLSLTTVSLYGIKDT